MAKYAYRISNGTKNDRVDAAKLSLHDDGVFCCTTPGCQARMYLRSPQKASACFVSYSVAEHTGGTICHLKDQFKPNKYEEKLFSLEKLFDNLLNKKENDSPSQYGSGGKGTNQRIAINSLKMLYLMCLQYRDGGSYNGYLIDDILIDKYNFDKYFSIGITGNYIIACTFWKYDSNEQCIYMNCPDDLLTIPKEQHKTLKIYVKNTEMFEKCATKLKDKTHSKISVIAANWTNSSDSTCLAECELVSVGKQICKGD
jgi:hypothetical protein